MAVLVAADSAAVTYFVLATSIVLPAVVLAVIIWVFFRAARRNDEREAREAAGRRP